MRNSIVILFSICFASFATAQHLDNRLPVKSDSHVMSNPVADGREGGETFEDAYPMGAVPWNDGGATCDNIDDYDEVCPYDGSTSPDVVYSWISMFDGALFVDLCGSSYDTKLYMYDSGLNLIDCNDDFYFDDICGAYVSALEEALVQNGETYYIVVDGYGGDCGEYIIAADEREPCPCCYLDCPDGAQVEGEAPLVDGYSDQYNSGCAGSPPIWQWIECSMFCGIAGWYISDGGDNYRDTDDFICTAAASTVTWTVDAESSTNCYEILLPDCNNASILQSMTVGPCVASTIVIDTEPGTILHLSVMSANFTNPGDVIGNEYDYVFAIEGIEGISATKQQTWSSVKSLYR